MRVWPLLFWFALLFSSCVTNKKVQFLQKGDVNQSNLPKDTVLREYPLTTFDYRIQPNDILSIRFESLSPGEFDFLSRANQNAGNGVNNNIVGAQLNGHLVDPDGNIPLPVIGKIHVSGYTIFELQDTLQQIAANYVEEPVVRVRLLNFRITILGEVAGAGTITLQNNRVSIIEAIGEVGGFSDLADRANVKLIRQIEGKTQIQYINLLEEEFLESSNYFVYQNDILVVPPLRQRPFRRYFGQNVSLIVSTISLVLLIYNILN